MSNVVLTQEQVEQKVLNHYENKAKLISIYKNRRTALELECLECGNRWTVMPQSVFYERYKGKCPKCLFRDYKPLITNCAYCGKEIKRPASDANRNKTGFFYCSRECGNLHKNQLRRENGEWKKSCNYRINALETYEHKCLVCGWDEDERILEAHHIDENHNNNHIDNLCLLCPTCHRKISLGYYKLENNKLIKIK